MYEVIIIGGGQAGLALGYLLREQQRHFVILDAAPEVGHSWRTRWDSLRLFTPCPYNNLPGLAFPKPPCYFPTKDDVADYLQLYAATFELPIATNQRVLSLERDGRLFRVATSTDTFEAQQVVIATGPFQTPLVPGWSVDLPSQVVQLHSSRYRNPQQLPPGLVLVVGAGNSGVQIARELSHTHTVWLSVGRAFPSVPERVSRHLWFWRLYLGVAAHLTTMSPLGPWLRKQDTLFGNSLSDLRREHDVTLVDRARALSDGYIQFEDGQSVAPSSVLWATGFQPDYSWVELPICNERGRPQQRGGATVVPGLYFLGLFWQTWGGSSLLGGVERDARVVASKIASVAGHV